MGVWDQRSGRGGWDKGVGVGKSTQGKYACGREGADVPTLVYTER